MAVTSTKPYVGVPRDLQANFNGKQIVYVCWEGHLLFAAPMMLVVEPEMKLGDLLEQVLRPLLQADPDAAGLDFAKAEWSKGRQTWQPDLQASIADNGITHKTQLVFRTPGLNTLAAVA